MELIHTFLYGAVVVIIPIRPTLHAESKKDSLYNIRAMWVSTHTHVKPPAFSSESAGRRDAYWPVCVRRRGRHHGLVLGADVAVRPDPSAAGAENIAASGARHSGGLALGARLQAAHCLALQHRAPGLAGVQLHSCRESKALEVNGHFWVKMWFSWNTATWAVTGPDLWVWTEQKFVELFAFALICLNHGQIVPQVWQ